jgi:MSHA biogenesis protein MshM
LLSKAVLKLALLTSACLCAFLTSAQSISIDPNSSELSIARSLEYYEDRSESLDIGAVLAPNFDVNFIPNNRDTLHFGVTSSAYWVRFNLDWSQMAHGASKIIEFGPPKLVAGLMRGGIELYTADDNGNILQQYSLGRQSNPRELKTFNRGFALIVDSEFGSNFYLKITALEDDKDFSIIIGEVGAGKTMLCRKVLNALEVHKNKYVTAYIPHPILNEEGIMHALAGELSIELDPNCSYKNLLRLVSEELVSISDEGKSVILFIDEAQAMPEETLRAVYFLTKIDSEHGASLQVVLFGQPELNNLLKQPSLSHLGEELNFSFTLPAMDRDGVESYVTHRLSKAGYSGSSIFTTGAINNLYKASQGIPRLVNILAHKAMMTTFGKGDSVVNEAHVKAAIKDTEYTNQNKPLTGRLFAS